MNIYAAATVALILLLGQAAGDVSHLAEEGVEDAEVSACLCLCVVFCYDSAAVVSTSNAFSRHKNNEIPPLSH